jgi:hypothetical protein
VGVRALWVCVAFLFAAAALHLIAPAAAAQILSRPEVVRIVGVLLAVLGASALLAPGIPPRVLGVALLVSGIRRAHDPERMIETMAWASRLVHGLLILLAALGAAIVAYWTSRRVRAQ